MRVDELRDLYETSVANAQEIIARDGDLYSHSLIVAHHGTLEKVHELGAALVPADPKSVFRDYPADDIAMLIRPWPLDWSDIYGVLRNAVPEEMRDGLDALIALGEATGVDDAHKRVARPLMQHMGLLEKDVVRLALEQLCHAVDAVAIINIATAWAARGESRESIDRDLSDDPTAQEVLMVSLESLSLMATTIIEIKREPSATDTRDGGRFIGWGEKISQSGDTAIMGGRFFGLLKPLGKAADA